MNRYWISGICAALLLCPKIAWAAEDADKAAPSVSIRLMTTNIEVAADGSDTRTIHAELRANNEAGAAQASQRSLPYDITAQELTVLDAHTLKSDGRVLPVEASGIYDQPPSNQDASLVTGLRTKLVVFPQFAAGDVAVYTFKVVTKRPAFGGQFVYTEAYARTLAYEEIRETITAPKTLPLYIENHEVDFTRHEDGANVVYSWHYAAPKPVAEEAPTFAPLEHTPRFFASSFKDYAQLGRAYSGPAEARKLVTPKIRALADEITAGTADQKAQTQKLYEWVNTHIRYIAIELGTGSYIPHDVDAIVANGYGDCKDHDTLLQALLKAKGIEAQSILINAGGIYSLTNVPTLLGLDHVITFVPKFQLYLDSSVAGAPFAVLPMQEYGKPMVIASTASAAAGRMPLLQQGSAKIVFKTDTVLDKKGTLSGTSTTTASGPYAIDLRFIGLQIQAAGPTVAAKIMAANGYANPTASFTRNGMSGNPASYTISATFDTTSWEDKLAGKDSFFIPGGLRIFSLAGDGIMGPFDPGKMKPGEPTACYSAEAVEDISLTAPAGYQFSGLPTDQQIETPNLLFVSHWSLDGNTLRVHRDFTSKIDQPLCTGTVRGQSAAALKRVADSYNDTVSFTEHSKDTKPVSAAQSFFNSGYSHLNARENEMAIADFDKAIALDSSENYFYGARGSAYLYLEKYAPALEDFDQAVKLGSVDPRVYVLRGNVHRTLGHKDLAIADYRKAIALNSGELEAYANMGLVHLDDGQKKEALADFTKLIALEPEGAFAYTGYYGRGWAQTETQPDLALADLDKAIALQPDAAEAYVTRGMVKAQQGKQSGAIVDFDKALTLKPGNAGALLGRGMARYNSYQYALAIPDLDKGLALEPGTDFALYARGISHFQMKDYKLAITDLDQVLAKKPKEAQALFYRGGAKVKLGQKADGERDIAMAVKLDPSLGK